MSMNSEIKEFRNAIGPFLDIWKSIDVRVICIRLDKEWINLGTTIILKSEDTQEITSTEQLTKTEDFMALNGILSIKEIDHLLENLSNGVLVMNNFEIYYGRKKETEIRPTTHLRFQTQYRTRHLSFPNIDFTSYLLLGTGETIGVLMQNRKFEDLDWRLRALDTPYDGLDELAKSFLFHPLAKDRSLSFIWVLAPLNMRFRDDYKISKGKLEISVNAFGWRRMKETKICTIQYLLNGNTYRGYHYFNHSEWSMKEKLHVLEYKLPIEKCRKGRIFLIVKNVMIDELTFNNPKVFLQNERSLIHGHFDEGLTTLKKYLNGQGKEPARDFEIGVGWLLYLCGFNTISYGLSSQLQGEIDIVAFSSSHNYLMCVECTLERPDVKDKLSKLSLKSKKLENRLALDNYRILRLIFTRLKEDEIPISEKEKAEKEGIIIVSEREIEELIEISTGPEPLAKSISYLVTLTPRTASPSRYFKKLQK